MTPEIRASLLDAPFDKITELWTIIEREFGTNGRRWLAQNDRYYLLVRLLHRKDAIHPWLYDRCREVEHAPDGYLDLWAREHYKSTIITFAGILQEVLNKPDITIGIFSHTKPIAKAFLKQIQNELEANEELVKLFPEIFYENPSRDASSWSLEGIVVKRKSNPKECTVEAHGLVDGQPTSRHFELLVYDDVVTKESVSTPDQIRKTTEAWELSDNLGSATQGTRKWHIGTRYSYADTYEEMLKRGAVIARLHPATDDGTITGNPVFFSPQVWADKVKAQGEATIACQMLQNPLAGTQRMFNISDLGSYEVRPEVVNIYIMVDPARSKKKDSDNTAIVVLGLDYANNKYLLDGFSHKMDLRERWEKSAMLYHKWKRQPGVQNIYFGYESFGAQADLDYFEEQMQKRDEGGHFPVIELAWPREGDGSKMDRVQRLGPDFRAHKFFLPYDTDEGNLTKMQRKFHSTGQSYRVSRAIKRKDAAGRVYDLAVEFRLQMHYFPFGGKKDLVDAASRLYDMEPRAPNFAEPGYMEPEFV